MSYMKNLQIRFEELEQKLSKEGLTYEELQEHRKLKNLVVK